MYCYFSSSLLAQAQLGIEMTYLITNSISHLRCVGVYVSILTHLCNIKAALELKCLLACSTGISLLSFQTRMGALKAPASVFCVIWIRSTWVFWELIIYTESRPHSRPELESIILTWFICILKLEKPCSTVVQLKSRCTGPEEGLSSQANIISSRYSLYVRNY